MTSGDQWFEQTGDELHDHEYPDEGYAEDDWTDTAPCPACGTEVYEDSVQCPVCGTYITSQTNPWMGRPAWWILLGLLGLVATIAVLAGLLHG
ncbi:MAG TPA: zinc-ribbon domain-containing protein [Planctomycetaceae bacterium]|nr:zinc-ribbon domain-containing protein [Planctomycetaceae bacterium]